MPTLDATQCYDLATASAMLHCDPARLTRQARARLIPAVWQEGAWVFPSAWIDAAAGRAATDEPSIRTYWLERLSPPSSAARRPLRDTARLSKARDDQPLLTRAEARDRLFADDDALERMTKCGSLPVLLVHGEVRYDEALVMLHAHRGAGDPISSEAIDARAQLVRAWSQFEYEHGVAARTVPTVTSSSSTSTEQGSSSREDLRSVSNARSRTDVETGERAPDASEAVPVTTSPKEQQAEPAPGAYVIPVDLDFPPTKPLIEAEGFEVEDED